MDPWQLVELPSSKWSRWEGMCFAFVVVFITSMITGDVPVWLGSMGLSVCAVAAFGFSVMDDIQREVYQQNLREFLRKNGRHTRRRNWLKMDSNFDWGWLKIPSHFDWDRN